MVVYEGVTMQVSSVMLPGYAAASAFMFRANMQTRSIANEHKAITTFSVADLRLCFMIDPPYNIRALKSSYILERSKGKRFTFLKKISDFILPHTRCNFNPENN